MPYNFSFKHFRKFFPPIKNGFTLTELLITISIISIISTASAMVYIENLKRARDTQRLSDMQALRTAFESFYADYNRYPDVTNDNISSNHGEVIGGDTTITKILAPYMDSVPTDPLFNGNTTIDITDGSADHERYYYYYDPVHNQSNDNKGCYPPTHRFTPTCSCTTNTGDVPVFGFNRTETFGPEKLTKDTCLGPHMNADSADYTVSLE